MKTYQLRIVTENQNRPEKAENLAQLIKRNLGLKDDGDVSKYEKLTNSYLIAFSGVWEAGADYISEAVRLTDRVATPWTVQYFESSGEMELIFNKSETCRYRKQEYNVVHWAILEVTGVPNTV